MNQVVLLQILSLVDIGKSFWWMSILGAGGGNVRAEHGCTYFCNNLSFSGRLTDFLLHHHRSALELYYCLYCWFLAMFRSSVFFERGL